MKKILLNTLLLLAVSGVFAQPPQSFKYQTVVRNAGGTILASQAVAFRISILQGSSSGSVVYSETFTGTTNLFGLITLNLGQGSVVSGTFSNINWGNNTYFVKVEIDPAGGTAYAEAGTSQILSVPYALQSVKVQKLSDATPALGDMLYYDGSKWTNVTAGQPGQFLQIQTTNLPKWSGPAFATLTTTAVTAITNTTATSGGNITNDGGGAISERGVCWSTSANPTIADSKTSDGSGSGTFISSITGLVEGTKYYVRAYATNWTPSYGNEISFKAGLNDIEGNYYKVVTIGTQTWMAENLRTTKYRNGDLIGTTSPSTLDISGEATPKYQWAPNDNESNVAVYGRLYTWYAATDSRNICPTGWHVPTDAEMTTLATFAGGESVAGGKLKETGTTHWTATNLATDDYGFTALPAGNRASNGTFSNFGTTCQMWNTTELDPTNSWNRGLDNTTTNWYRGTAAKKYGFTIRCIKD